MALANRHRGIETSLVESFGAYCNDAYFGSDDGGIGDCIDFAALLSNNWYGALGDFQAGPESKSSSRFSCDPLDDRGRLILRVGKRFRPGVYEATATLKLGGEGGFVDDLTHEMRDALHGAFGMGTRNQRGRRSLRGVVGVSRHIWRNFDVGHLNGGKARLFPYLHSSAGTDNLEGGGGVALSLQPASVKDQLPFMEPQSGAYAPLFGGDGIGVFVAGRGVGFDTFYAGRAQAFIAEVGLLGQYTFSETVRGTALASCTTKPYRGALDADCKATLRVGLLY